MLHSEKTNSLSVKLFVTTEEISSKVENINESTNQINNAIGELSLTTKELSYKAVVEINLITMHSNY